MCTCLTTEDIKPSVSILFQKENHMRHVGSSSGRTHYLKKIQGNFYVEVAKIIFTTDAHTR